MYILAGERGSCLKMLQSLRLNYNISSSIRGMQLTYEIPMCFCFLEVAREYLETKKESRLSKLEFVEKVENSNCNLVINFSKA